MEPFIDYAGPVTRPPNDRRGGLIAYGVITIVLGALTGCGTILIPVSLVISRSLPTSQPAIRVSTIVLATFMYAALTAGLLIVGIGCCRMRRWVRPIVLCLAWPGLVGGLLAAIGAGIMMARMKFPGGGPSAPFEMGIIVGTIAVSMLIYVGVPLAYVLFFRSAHVQTTLDWYDPRRVWTDACPMPVLGLSIWLVLTAVGVLMLAIHAVAPLFGVMAQGPIAVLLVLAGAGAHGVAARACYQVKAWGWWLAATVLIGGGLSWALTWLRLGTEVVQRHMGATEEEIRMVREINLDMPPAMLVMYAITGLLALAYVLWVRRYFTAPPAESPRVWGGAPWPDAVDFRCFRNL